MTEQEFQTKIETIRYLMAADPSGENAFVAGQLHAEVKSLSKELDKPWLFDVVYDATDSDPSGLLSNFDDKTTFLVHAALI
ncbi:hypothetical protein F0236_21885 [Vibrio splendidus]|uniref:hypothetical protein n=1 Tax=Vibrio splendidus TaxID=29497 RepID=UPI00148DEDD3|nr:hypothetical protein [Vibrio splendidus]NOJ06387.1 hypothetical protein [Vibrio splendidus]